MNTDITASTKLEYPVVDQNPTFTKVVDNFSVLDYMHLSTIFAISIIVGYLSSSPPLLDHSPYRSPPLVDPHPNLISHFNPISSSDPRLSSRDQAGDPGSVDGHGWAYRGHGRVRVFRLQLLAPFRAHIRTGRIPSSPPQFRVRRQLWSFLSVQKAPEVIAVACTAVGGSPASSLVL
uniref:NADH-ubiquinone oxidoreductase 21kDa subunit N-terminal domain-containing protein n=1 Tax=Zea mays TaxID=4577 RepID=A0A804LWI6_MAIZE